ncbi:hypothetical protein [Streptomyces albicerus]|uniref:hypothetical protein n=1 Tax=Streptomyces albicerus TaxID=2569859 RepID=UPI001CED3A12|nr:hypothetical protein [Streptomyces albicerus]
MSETTRDAIGRTVRAGDTVGGTTSGRYQATIVGPVLKIGKGQVKVRVDKSGHTFTVPVGSEKWISTDRVFLIPAEQPSIVFRATVWREVAQRVRDRAAKCKNTGLRVAMRTVADGIDCDADEIAEPSLTADEEQPFTAAELEAAAADVAALDAEFPDEPAGLSSVLAEIRAERARQDAKWGEQNHPDGTGSKPQREAAGLARMACEDAFASGYGTWCHVLFEEVWEALAESDPAKLRAELVQAAAVAVNWIEAIDRRPT